MVGKKKQTLGPFFPKPFLPKQLFCCQILALLFGPFGKFEQEPNWAFGQVASWTQALIDLYHKPDGLWFRPCYGGVQTTPLSSAHACAWLTTYSPSGPLAWGGRQPYQT